MTSDASRKPKKSETLEVRLPYETKQAFLVACREDGTTASEVVRGSIDDYLDARGRPEKETQPRSVIAMIPAPIRKKRYLAIAGGLAGLAALAALPSAADPDIKGRSTRSTRTATESLRLRNSSVTNSRPRSSPRRGARCARTDLRLTPMR